MLPVVIIFDAVLLVKAIVPPHSIQLLLSIVVVNEGLDVFTPLSGMTVSSIVSPLTAPSWIGILFKFSSTVTPFKLVGYFSPTF